MQASFIGCKRAFVFNDQLKKNRRKQRAQTQHYCEGAGGGLIQWLDNESCLGVSADALAVRQIRDEGYRGLVANQMLESEKTIFSLPLEMTIMQNMQNTEFPWSVDMGMQLLKYKHQYSPDNFGQLSRIAWLNSLPAEIQLPSLHFSDEEIAQFEYEDIVQEIYVIKQMHKQSYEQLKPELDQMGFGWEEFSWACSVMLSRCFIFGEDERHISVPGIDMCNHSFAASAGVRMVHNPEQCQGQDATLDIAPPTAVHSTPISYFQLQTAEQPLKVGSEISICYGEWPNDLFALFFGFVPDDNPHDQFVLFYTFRDIVGFVLWLSTKKTFQLDQLGEKILQDIVSIIQQKGLNDEDISGQMRLCVYKNGMDDGLIVSVKRIGQHWSEIKHILQAHGFQDIKSPSLGEILIQRCFQKLQSFGSSLEQDMLLLQQSDLSDNQRVAVKFRVSKKQVLQAALRSLTSNKF